VNVSSPPARAVSPVDTNPRCRGDNRRGAAYLRPAPTACTRSERESRRYPSVGGRPCSRSRDVWPPLDGVSAAARLVVARVFHQASVLWRNVKRLLVEQLAFCLAADLTLDRYVFRTQQHRL